MDYQPTEADIYWMEQVTLLLADGGRWGWPDTGMVFRHDRRNKRLVLENPELLTDPYTQEMFDRCVTVCRKIGYLVTKRVK